MPAIGFEASAPGKLILMGEHAAVYGRPALVAAIGLRTCARVEPVPSPGVEFELSDLDCREQCSWAEVIEYGNRRREEWLDWHDANDGQDAPALPSLGSRGGSGLVKVAAAEAVRALGEDGEASELPGIRLSVSSRLPRGAGLGSSASVTVAVGAALLGSLAPPGASALEPGDRRIETVAMEAEKRQHGRPSGVDHTAVIQGGFLAVAREADRLRATRLPRPEWLQSSIRVFDTGTPAESTGEVVAAVRRTRDRDPAAFVERLDRMELATSVVTSGLTQAEAPWPALLGAVTAFELCLEELGVVPAPVARAARRIEAAGGAAKISGAGSLSGAAAGSLLVLWPPGTRGEDELDRMLEGYSPLVAPLGSAGIELPGDPHA